MPGTLEIASNPAVQQYRQLLSDPEFQQMRTTEPAKYRQLLAQARAAASGRPLASGPAMSTPATSMGPNTFRRPLPATEQQTAAGIASTMRQMAALRQRLQAFGADKWNRAGGESRQIGGVETAGAPTRYWDKWARAHGMVVGGSDPDTQELNTLMGQAITQHSTSTAALIDRKSVV